MTNPRVKVELNDDDTGNLRVSFEDEDNTDDFSILDGDPNTFTDFTLLDGESSLTVFSSEGSDGKIAAGLVFAEVDGGMTTETMRLAPNDLVSALTDRINVLLFEPVVEIPAKQ